MCTGNPGLARVMRYAPTRSPPRITRQYMLAIVTAILMEQAATLPHHTASGSKSTSGIIMSPRPMRRAFLVPSVLMLNSHIIGTRCWPVSGRNWERLSISNLVSSVSIALFHSGIAIAFQKSFGMFWCDVEAHEVGGLDDGQFVFVVANRC
jgi:hypothetical protein